MTNEEKAREYQAFIENNNPSAEAYGFYNAYISACDWKDNELRKIIDEEINRANRYYNGHYSTSQRIASVRVVSILSKYLNEEFPKDKFNFSFTTID